MVQLAGFPARSHSRRVAATDCDRLRVVVEAVDAPGAGLERRQRVQTAAAADVEEVQSLERIAADELEDALARDVDAFLSELALDEVAPVAPELEAHLFRLGHAANRE